MRYLFFNIYVKLGQSFFRSESLWTKFERTCARRRQDCTEARALTDDGIVRNGCACHLGGCERGDTRESGMRESSVCSTQVLVMRRTYLFFFENAPFRYGSEVGDVMDSMSLSPKQSLHLDTRFCSGAAGGSSSQCHRRRRRESATRRQRMPILGARVHSRCVQWCCTERGRQTYRLSSGIMEWFVCGTKAVKVNF
jgi:hypothetical protein